MYKVKSISNTLLSLNVKKDGKWVERNITPREEVKTEELSGQLNRLENLNEIKIREIRDKSDVRKRFSRASSQNTTSDSTTSETTSDSSLRLSLKEDEEDEENNSEKEF